MMIRHICPNIYTQLWLSWKIISGYHKWYHTQLLTLTNTYHGNQFGPKSLLLFKKNLTLFFPTLRMCKMFLLFVDTSGYQVNCYVNN